MRARIAASLAAALLVLTGCATPQQGGAGGGEDRTGEVGEVLPRDVPSGWTGPQPDGESAGPLVGWIDDEQFGVITLGSGSCYPEATAIEATGEGSARIDFEMPPDDAICTADFAPTTHAFTLPPAVTQFPVALELVLGDEVIDAELPAP
ncbi:hypothetical protein [Microbacterium sp. Marseille-Q6965]|uniref:hypothetical protein n=1 Tax=Microbacterium sp. Marseille-Q6965 TaxID=2965072 RepID=UPI0021B7EEDA|nr:hypothetical protein [Microbacterium sp. Marseille-Q6965]